MRVRRLGRLDNARVVVLALAQSVHNVLTNRALEELSVLRDDRRVLVQRHEVDVRQIWSE